MFKKIVPYVILLLIAVFVYRDGIFSTDKVLTSSDYNTTSVVWRQAGSSDGTMGGIWERDYVAGWADQVLPANIFGLTIKAFPPATSLTMVYFLSSLLVGVFFFMFMRSCGLSRAAALFGGISLMLSNHFLTVIYPGHAAKFTTFVWIPLVFLFLRKAVREDRWTHYVYSGFFLGLALQGQFYEAVLFFAMLAFAYWLHLILVKRAAGQGPVVFFKTNLKKLVLHKLGLLVVALMTVVMSIQLIPYMAELSGAKSVQEQSAEAKWDFATAWSLPPEETIDFFVPGIFGWKSGDPEAPYWGRMGKPSVPSGLKLNSENVGLVTLLFVALAVYVYRKRRGEETGFWLGVIVVTLVFAFGRHIPVLYKLFYSLPYMDSIRNPNKMIWVTMFAVSLLGAKGFDALFTDSVREKFRERVGRFANALKYVVYGAAAVFLVSLFASGALRDIIMERTGNAHGADQLIGFIPLAFLLATAIAAIMWFVARGTVNPKTDAKTRRIIIAIPILLVCVELWLSGRHFVVYTPQETTLDYNGMFSVQVRGNQLAGVGFHKNIPDPVVDFLKKNTAEKHERVYVIVNQLTDFYSRHLLPYHGIACANWNPNPRIPDRFAGFMQATGFNGQSMTQEYLYNMNVRYVLALEQPGKTNAAMPIVATFPLRTWPEKQPTGLVFNIYEVQKTLPRVFVARARHEAGSTEAAVAVMRRTNANLRLAPIVENGAALVELNKWDQSLSLATLTNTRGTITLYGQCRTTVAVETPEPALLVLLDMWHKDWHATVNGKESAIVPVNVLFRGVAVPAGKSEVKFEYYPPKTQYAITLGGYLLVLLVAAGECFVRRKRRRDS